MPKLTDDAITEAIAAGPWRREGDTLVRDVETADFATALALVNAIGAEAERLGHHPDLLLHGYRHVRVTSSTHSEGAITPLDLALAAAVDALVDA